MEARGRIKGPVNYVGDDAAILSHASPLPSALTSEVALKNKRKDKKKWWGGGKEGVEKREKERVGESML